ncbi:MAG: hypothetical protein ABH845_00250 [Candidatus Omnitrophota bacterium]
MEKKVKDEMSADELAEKIEELETENRRLKEAKDTERKRPSFTGGDVRDDVIDWAEKMKALGEAWGALSWHVDRYDGDSEALARCGETLGRIITEYAELIENAVIEYGIKKNPLARYEETLKWIEDSKGEGGSAGVINYEIKSIADFIHTVALPAFDLKQRFEEMKKKYPVKQESDPAAESAAAGA